MSAEIDAEFKNIIDASLPDLDETGYAYEYDAEEFDHSHDDCDPCCDCDDFVSCDHCGI